MLPKQYTQAVMSGESLAGFLVSSNRVLTKLIIDNDRVSTVLFFLTSTVYIALVMAYIVLPSILLLRPDEDMSPDRQKEYNSTNSKYGVLNFDASSSRTPKSNTSTQALSFSNPVYELSNPTAGESILDDLNNLSDAPQTPSQEASTSVSFKVEHVLTPGPGTSGKLSDFKSGFESRKKVSELIYPYMVSIALAYCVTLSLYPGIESEIVSCTYRTWMPVLLMFAFNLSDLIGKLLAVIPYNWSRRQLILMSGLRVVLIPLLLLCAAPRNRPVIAGEFAAFIFTIALGITNGLAGSLPMMLAPLKVPAILREVTGNMMTLSYNVGLTAGSLIGYVFESMLGSGTSLEES
uniref:Major facilitator superfamily (MFS) profile domain-containing protein n=1 Tax=Megaselia scalaris TaxID=36166 RepID=T1H364_MEGSC